MTWTIEKRKQGNEIWVTSNVLPESILVGEGYDEKEYKRSMELAKVVVKALNKHEARRISSFGFLSNQKGMRQPKRKR